MYYYKSYWLLPTSSVPPSFFWFFPRRLCKTKSRGGTLPTCAQYFSSSRDEQLSTRFCTDWTTIIRPPYSKRYPKTSACAKRLLGLVLSLTLRPTPAKRLDSHIPIELADFQWRNTRGQSWQQAAKMCPKDLISQGLLNVCDVNLNLVIRVEGAVHVTTDAIQFLYTQNLRKVFSHFSFQWFLCISV